MIYIARTDRGVSLLVLSKTAHSAVMKKAVDSVRGTIVETIDPDLHEGESYNWVAGEIHPIDSSVYAAIGPFKQAKKEFLAAFFRGRIVKDE